MSAQRSIDGVNEQVPNVARIYDYLLGGKDNYAADRDAAERLLAAAPETAGTVRENRAFLRRAVRRLAAEGFRQFVDIGAGLPTQANVHEVAREITPDARVVYVDNDPVVVAHGRALLTDSPRVTVLEGDLRRPAQVLAEPALRALIDLGEPVAVLMLAVLHFVTDDQDPAGIVRRVRGLLPPGSALILSHVTSEGNRAEAASTAKNVYDRSTASIALRTRAEILSFFEGFELDEPGLVYAPEWHPDGTVPFVRHPEASFLFAGVGRLPR
ncbi:SAM-dependent methyltransferase [Actinomadura rudentiformis]|uniref:SAM-dependent methyltransferase n=1 Tax=Actinomadura rudentiformis TaxID=359158 RepID=A0A6H9Z3X5_9ACTN|nr:SAM-dependent methyltransferase [Actinomadura rudentiformis]KAB2352822.1 SAM-dependent methyltransferase [Actinomadura rudentiformis]